MQHRNQRSTCLDGFNWIQKQNLRKQTRGQHEVRVRVTLVHRACKRSAARFQLGHHRCMLPLRHQEHAARHTPSLPHLSKLANCTSNGVNDWPRQLRPAQAVRTVLEGGHLALKYAAKIVLGTQLHGHAVLQDAHLKGRVSRCFFTTKWLWHAAEAATVTAQAHPSAARDAIRELGRAPPRGRPCIAALSSPSCVVPATAVSVADFQATTPEAETYSPDAQIHAGNDIGECLLSTLLN